MNTVGILYICTGKYEIFWKDFYLSAEKYFLKESEVHYFVFTDADTIFDEEKNQKIHKIYQENLGWPDSTLRRFSIFLQAKEQMKEMNYLFFFNANLEIQVPITEQEFLLGTGENYLAALHPGYFRSSRKKYPYEKNPISMAYIADELGKYYFQGALQGGRSTFFLDACSILADNVNIDSSRGIMSIWHDESHWNCFLSKRTDIHVLDPGYIFPEGGDLPFQKKILMKDKRRISDFGDYYYKQGRKISILSRLLSLFH